MKVKDRRALGVYIRAVADRLTLRDWTIHLDNEDVENGLQASACCARYQREITIAFSAHFRDQKPEDQRETVVHELLHAHFESCWRMVQTDLDDPLGKVAYYIFCDAYRANMELAVDALAKAIAPTLPLIDWVE